MTFRKPELIPTVFFIASFVTLCVLGFWQLERLSWKQAIIAQTMEAKDATILANLPQDIEGHEYRRVALTGRFLHDKTIHLIGRQQGMRVGYYMVTPFSLEDDGRIILINRGFSPPDEETRPEGLVTVVGMLRPPREKRFFAPANVADKNIWSYEDMNVIADMVDGELLPLVVEATGTREEGVYPIANDGKIIYRNDHLGYAVTWFGLALVSVIMFAAYYRKPKQS